MSWDHPRSGPEALRRGRGALYSGRRHTDPLQIWFRLGAWRTYYSERSLIKGCSSTLSGMSVDQRWISRRFLRPSRS